MNARTTVAGVQRMFASLAVTTTTTATTAATKPVSRLALQSTTARSFVTTSSITTTINARVISSWSLPSPSPSRFNLQTTRGFASKDNKDDATSQHLGWIDFQKSIAVEGFETGQTTETKRNLRRGGRRLSQRKSKEELKLEERIAERQRLTDIGGGEYPPLRYSDAETERLLAQAYAAIPPRGGKRGTRNLKRQKRRWWLVRKIHKKYKKNMLRYQERKMAERSRRIQSVKTVLADAPSACNKDREYQFQVWQRWMATHYPDKMPAKKKEEGTVPLS